MALSYKDTATIAADPIFQGRCLAAAAVAAMSVMGESVATKDHFARVAFCQQILAGSVPGARIAAPVLTQAAVTAVANVGAIATDAGVSDAILLGTMPTVLTALAGIANTP